MSSERLNAALQALQQSRVTPELISDEMVRGLPTRRSTVAWWLAAIGVVAVIGVGVWMNRQMFDHDQDAAHTQHSMSGASGQGADQQHPAAGVSTSDSVRSFNDEGLDTLDPNSILVLNLSDQELSRLGISRNNDTVYVTMQSLVVDDPAIAKKLGLEPATLRDSSALFHWRCSATPTGVDHIVPTTYDGTTLDHLVPYWVYSIDSNNYISPIRALHQAIVDQSERDNELSLANHQFVYAVSVDSLEYEARLPDSLLPRDRKPIMVQIHNRQTRQRVVLLYMPTAEFIKALPSRFNSAINHCYDEFVPKKPRAFVYPKAAPFQVAKLVKVDGVVGQPVVELKERELNRIGIMCDSLTIVHAEFGGKTFDTLRTSFRKFVTSTARMDDVYMFHYTKGVVSRDGVDTAMMFSRETRFPQCHGVSSVVELSPDGKSVDTYGMVVFGGNYSRYLGWLNKYPKAMSLALKVANTMTRDHIPIDSISHYWIVENGVVMPVTRLLVPVRVSTPWTTHSTWNGISKRLVEVYWYLPTQQFLDSLPERISSFILPEYEAAMRYVEEKLSADELCSLLEKPSAFGLCSIGDTALRIDGVGPIPARESFTVFMQCALATTATIKLISDDGRTVLERSQISLVKGANQIPIQLAGQNIPQGAYTVVVTCAEGTRTSRVLVAAQ